MIDADALDSEMYHKSFEVDDGRNVWNSGLWIRYKIFEEAIRDAPTVDAVPVIHGRWMSIGGHCICMVCFYKGGIIPTRYCPNCGAKMGEVEHETD